MEAKRVKFRSSRLAVLFSLVASLVWLASVAGAVAPVLVSSDPAAGESGVNPFLGSFSLRFEQPMRNQGSLAITGPWGAGELLLVGDRTFFHSRSNPGTELPAGATITVTVNPPGSTNPFANLAGEPAATSTFSFTIASGGGSPRVLSSVPSRGAIEVGPALGSIVVQVSEPMNPSYRSFTLPTAWGTSSASWTPDYRTLTILRDDTSQPLPARDLVTLVLNPAGSTNYFRDFDGNPLPKTTIEFGVEPYEHFPAVVATDPPNGAVTEPGLERIDLQLIAMVADARRRLAERDLTVGPRILMNGFSASGAFAHRFTALHPQLVKATASGSGAGWPIAPVAEWSGIDLRHPVGIAEQESLVGTPFSASGYRGFPLFLFVGTEDENDPVPGWDSVDRDAVFALTGVTSGPIWPRWLVSEDIHAGAGMTAAQFAIYPGVGHTVTSAMSADIQAFLANPLPEPEVAPGLLAALVTLAGIARSRRRGHLQWERVSSSLRATTASIRQPRDEKDRSHVAI